MSRPKKIVLSTMLVIGLAVGYGIYWWYESEEPTPAWLQSMGPSGMSARDVRAILSSPDGTPEKALKRLESMNYDRQKDVLLQLVEDPEELVRVFAVTNLFLYRSEPQIKDLLQGLSQNDPSPVVRGTAFRIIESTKKGQKKEH